jgi:hypothetical protein
MNDVLKTFADLKAAKGPTPQQPKPVSSLQTKPYLPPKPQPALDIRKKVR